MSFTATAAPVRYPARLVYRLVATDFVMFLSAFFLASGVVHAIGRGASEPRLIASMVVSSLLWLAIFERAGSYRESLDLRWWDEFYWVAATVILGIVPQLALFAFLPQMPSSRLLLVVAALVAIVTVSLARIFVKAGWQTDGRLDCRIAVVGDPQRVASTETLLRQAEHVAVLPLPLKRWNDDVGSIGLADWFGAARAWQADRILFTEVPNPAAMPGIALTAMEHRIAVSFAAPRILGDIYKHFDFDNVGRQGVIVPIVPRACRRPGATAKRVFDIVFALAGLVLFCIPMLVAAVAIFVESGAPVLLRQQRVGKDGKPFDMFKFRSMRRNAEETTGAVWAIAGDRRITTVGRILRRTSLDELPQIFNVLNGQMSIVGPRPERPVFAERFRRQLPNYDGRNAVLPGITGWSHVYMDRNIDTSAIEQRLGHDLFYIEHWSVLMDLAIVCKTACEFLFHSVAA
ncbi:MAG TPA: exopolysaccharide biosynthesis polyprenyl glycosylphosphotransferase [Candidatus Baltobacteraceae bacterium]|jgi:exopolysaccharide biosynthesis polyprenyl glycosylphosphotransferase